MGSPVETLPPPPALDISGGGAWLHIPRLWRNQSSSEERSSSDESELLISNATLYYARRLRRLAREKLLGFVPVAPPPSTETRTTRTISSPDLPRTNAIRANGFPVVENVERVRRRPPGAFRLVPKRFVGGLDTAPAARNVASQEEDFSLFPGQLRDYLHSVCHIRDFGEELHRFKHEKSAGVGSRPCWWAMPQCGYFSAGRLRQVMAERELTDCE